MSHRRGPQASRRSSDSSRFHRRSFLRLAGATGVAGLAGCLGGGDGDDGSNTDGSGNGDGSGGDDGTRGTTTGGGSDMELTLGIQAPLSGVYGSSGKAVANAIQLAADDAVNDGQFSNIETSVSDTQTDPNTGRQRAQEHINNGADMLAGNISSATALAIGELAQRNDILYDCVAGSNAVTGSKCISSTFAWSDSAVMQLGGGLGYVLDNDLHEGNKIFMISADYEWGQSLAQWTNDEIAPANDLEVVGNKFMPFGASDYSSPLTQARNANPDILLMNMSGTDQITSLPQTKEFGLLDDTLVVYAATNIGDAASVDQELLAHENYYSSIAWYWDHDYSSASTGFIDRYTEQYPDAIRDAYIGSFYAGVRASLNAIAATGSTSLSDVRGEIEDAEIDPQLWGIGELMRGCDHRATIATTTVKGKAPDEVSDQDYYEVIDVPDKETVDQRMRTCEQTGCQF